MNGEVVVSLSNVFLCCCITVSKKPPHRVLLLASQRRLGGAEVSLGEPPMGIRKVKSFLCDHDVYCSNA